VRRVHEPLDRFHELVVLIRGIVCKNVHLQAYALLNQGLANSSRADHGNRLAADFIAKKWQKRMPRAPFVFAHQLFTWPELARDCAQHEERELRGRIGQHMRSVGEWNLVSVSLVAVDVVKTNRVLRDYLQGSFARFENLSVNGIAQSGNQRVNTAAHFFDDQGFRRRLWSRINFQLIAFFPQTIEPSVADVTRGKDAEFP